MKFKFLFIFTLAASSLFAQNIRSPSFGKGLVRLVAKDSSWAMKVGLRFQTLATVRTMTDSRTKSNFSIRRARLKFSGFAFSPKLKYKVELGLSNKDISGGSKFTSNAPRYILDAVIKWNFYKHFDLWFGQTKLPGNRERLVSSANLQQVERSALNSAFNIDRDLGIQLRHHFNLGNQMLIREVFSIAQGEGRNITSGNIGGLQYTTRLEVLPFGKFSSKGDYSGGDLVREETPKLAFGVSYDLNQNAVKTKSNKGKYMFTDKGFFETDISTLFVDAMFKYQGYSFLLEYAKRQADRPKAIDSKGLLTGSIVQVGQGFNAQMGIFISEKLELSARFTNITLDEDLLKKPAANYYTLGLSKYIVGHKLKIQGDATYQKNKGVTPTNMLYRMQFDIHF